MRWVLIAVGGIVVLVGLAAEALGQRFGETVTPEHVR